MPIPVGLSLALTVFGGAFGAFGATLSPPTTLIETGAVWRYLDPGSTPGDGWMNVEFDDDDWRSGRAPFGYGRGNEATLLDPGPDSFNKPITSYFRHTIDVPDPKTFSRVTLRLFRDDAAVVYLNGEEIRRINLPSRGPIDPGTVASNQVFGIDGTRFHPIDAWPGYLRTNKNVLAVELHQYSPTDTDAWFDMPVVANLPYTLPTVQWTSPANGSILPWDDLVLTATASDEDSSIWKVEFYVDGTLLAEDTTEPYIVNWFDPPQGRFRLRAETVDNTGRRGASADVAIQLGTSQADRILRGPYLQSATPRSIIICWRTDWFTTGVVRYGTDPEELSNVVTVADDSLNHFVELDGLQPATRYFYNVGTPTEVLSEGADHYFVTAPLTAQPTRIWAIGDSGTADENARDVHEAYLGYAAGRHTDIWLMLGDNAYESGTDQQYQEAVFEMYRQSLPNTVLWPTIGNHDNTYGDAAGQIAYLDIFTLPRFGEAGGVASGTERYYSFDHGDTHFVCLDSSGSDRAPGSPMLQWVEADLVSTSAEWIIAYWHHPPYTLGSHRSDFERDLIEMRVNVLPILEAHGVDVVLCGHSHNYERSFLLRGHYGYSTNLLEHMILDAGSGNPELDWAYHKPAGGLGNGHGTVYTVCGCSGEGGSGTISLHPAMFTAFSGYGSVVLDILGSRLEARMLTNTGLVRDMFVIEKGDPQVDPAPGLRLRRTPAGMELSWPTSTLNYRLESSDGTSLSWEWAPFPGTPEQVGRRHVVLLPDEGAQQFYRLRSVDLRFRQWGGGCWEPRGAYSRGGVNFS